MVFTVDGLIDRSRGSVREGVDRPSAGERR
jgi:hypothetical protein